MAIPFFDYDVHVTLDRGGRHVDLGMLKNDGCGSPSNAQVIWTRDSKRAAYGSCLEFRRGGGTIGSEEPGGQACEAWTVQEEVGIGWRSEMIYLKSVLAGIGGSILALILFVVVIVAMNILRLSGSGMVGIRMPIPIALAALGFILGFYLVYRNSN